jgi:hypothetical protein
MGLRLSGRRGTSVTIFILVCAARCVRRWLAELGPVKMDRARRYEFSRLDQ